jgi:GR25 family glycosyltransferase involved in LPS biosynthesis
MGVLFEDDVVLEDDFSERLVAAHAALPDDWDMLLLNWYCNEGHWKECTKNRGDHHITKDLVEVKFFMSGM